MEAAADLAFAGPARPIGVAGGGALLAAVRDLAPDWPMAEPGEADVVVARDAAGWRVTGRRWALPGAVCASELEAANALLGGLLVCYAAQDESRAVLHAAAVEFAGGVLALVGDNGAGKSTLALALAVAGFRFWGDDRLILRRGPSALAAEATGLAAKARLPLPVRTPAAHRAFVEARRLYSWPELAILELAPAERVPFGALAPLAGFVFLDRREHAAPDLAPEPAPAVARRLIAATHAPQLSAAGLVAAAAAWAAAPGWRLVYGDAWEAAAFLAARFGR